MNMKLSKSQIHDMLKRFMQETISNYDRPAVHRDYVYKWDRDAFNTPDELEEYIDSIDEVKDFLNTKMRSGDYGVARQNVC